VAHLGASNSIIVANARSGISSYRDLLAASKQPGRIFWATFGDASMPDVIRRWTNLKAGVEITGVPYKGFAPATQALVAGEVQVGLGGLGTTKGFLASGALKPIAIIGSARSELYPAVPTLEELGLDFGLPNYFGLYAPPGTPADVATRMHANVQKALDSAAMKQVFQAYTLDRLDMSQQQFDRYIRDHRKRAGEVFKALGIRPGAIPE
jgi:tripartite-type tricarboxylate transporter receptor subunit TctC